MPLTNLFKPGPGVTPVSLTPFTNVYAQQDSAQTLSTSVYTKILFAATNEIDTLGEWDPTTGTFTAATAKTVRIIAYISFISNSTGYRAVKFYKNGTATDYVEVTQPISGDVTLTPHMAEITLAAGDTLDVRAIMVNATGTITTSAAFTRLTIREVPIIGIGGGSGGDLVSSLLNTEVSVTGAVTLDSTAFGKMHACSGTSANYTVGLPAAAGNAGKFIGLRMVPALTKLVTIDGNASELIDGATTKVMWAQETAVLYCDGTGYAKIAGQARAMGATMRNVNAGDPSQGTLCNSATLTKIALNQTDEDTGSLADTTNQRINVRRAGTYEILSLIYFNSFVASRIICDVFKNGSIQLMSAETNTATSSAFGVPQCPGRRIFAAGDYLELRAYQDSGIGRRCYADPTGAASFLTLKEAQPW